MSTAAVHGMYEGSASITVGERLRELRSTAGLSRAELGRRLHVAGQTISRYESGGAHIRADDIPTFAQALHVDPCDFFRSDRPAMPSQADRDAGGLIRFLIDRLPDDEQHRLIAYLQVRTEMLE